MKKFLLTTFIITLIGCSSQTKLMKTPETVNVNLTKEEIHKSLAKLVDQAKISGPKAEEFLATDFFLKASSAQIYGDYQTAVMLYQHLLKLKSDDHFIKSKYAISLIRIGELEEAQKVLGSVYAVTKGKDEKIGLLFAGVNTALGKNDDAKNVYVSILKEHPSSQDACLFLSKSFSSEKLYQKAINVLKKCEKYSNEKEIFAYYLGKTYLDRADLVNAFKEFSRAQKIDPTFSQATLAIGLIHEEKGNNKLAIENYRKYLDANPEDKMILSRLIQVYFTIDNTKDVLPYAERLAQLEADNLNLKVKLGIIYSDNKNYPKAIETFKDILKHNPTSDRVLYFLGAIYQETNQFDDAVKYFKEIPSSSALYQDATVQVSQMLMTKASNLKDENFKQNSKEFISYIEDKLKEIPKAKVELSIIQASYFENIEDNKNAINSMESIVNDENFQESHRYYLASLYEKEKMHEESRAVINEVLNKNPNNSSALNFMGYSLVEQGQKLDLAFDYIMKAYKLNPKDGYIKDSIGWYYFKIGKFEQALKHLIEAKKLVKDDPIITKHLAQIYEAMKKFTEAKSFYVEALSHCKYEHERKDIYESLNTLESKRFPASEK